ncbi:VCBS repeat protein [Streptomyces sp. TLI_235]|nr:FG-GAP-like repeat-containing protein [Streptomyces sp. TLI_235]PBC71061.1 VCBS repeat protein [Streptomyces sp. TLI_235]
MDDGSVSPEDQALKDAKAGGAPVEVTAARTELSDTWAKPDGTFTVRRYGSPVRIWRGAAWVPTDPALEFAADGTVRPKAASVSVTFSGGGTGPLLSGVKDGRTLTYSWPSALPRPTLNANVATYAEVLPGVDLQLKAEVEGFSQLLVVKTPEAAANPQLATLKYTMSTVGLTVTTDATTGSIKAADPAGQTVFTSPTPLMWDSGTTASTGTTSTGNAVKASYTVTAAADTTSPTPGSAFEQPVGAKDAQMPTTVSGNTLQITPDQNLLKAADTKYPVFIDPSTAWGIRQNWTRVSAKYRTTSYWNANEVARVGHEDETGGLSRSFFQMDTSNIAGAKVINSTFRINNVWSWSCQARPVELWRTDGINQWTTWNHQPERHDLLATVNESKGWSSSACPGGNLEFDVTDKVRELANNRQASVTFGLYAQDETDTFAWRKFDSRSYVLETTYNNPPLTPWGLGTNPSTDCANGGLIGNTTVGLHAHIDDPDAGNLYAEFQVFRNGASTPSVDQYIPALKDRIATFTVPDSQLPDGSYQWKVRAKDELGEFSGWSDTCRFSVDRTRPKNVPAVSSAVFPSGENGWPAGTGKARTAGSFTLSPNGETDVVQFGYYTDFDPTIRNVGVAKGSPVDVQITPPGYGPHLVYAFSMDAAQNRSDTAVYVFYAAGTGARDNPGDLNGDANNDIWTVDSNGILLTYAGQGNGRFSSATNGGPNFAGSQVTYRGDWGRDGYTDLVTLEYDPVEKRKRLWAYPNNGFGLAMTSGGGQNRQELKVRCPVPDPDRGCDQGGADWTGDDHWRDADQIVGSPDLNGDGRSDLLVKQGKFLWAYYGDRSKRLDSYTGPTLVGGGNWDKYTVIAPGDTDGDNIPDLWLRDDASGDLYRSPGKLDAFGKLDPTAWGDPAALVRIGSGVTAAGYPVIGSVGDFTGDGLADLWARKADNTVLLWPGKTPGADRYAFANSTVIDGITGGARIPSGTTISSGQSLTSASNRLTMQADGNLVVYSKANKALWASNTGGTPGATAIMQTDGNLVVRRPDGSTAWQSGTSGNSNGYAVLQDRGNLVLYNVKGQSLWATGTVVRHDYNGDGRSDLAAWYNYADGHDAVHTLTTNSDGSFNRPFQSLWAPDGWYYVENMKFATGDYNGDGRSDTAALYCYGDGSVKLLTGLGKPDGGIADLVGSWSSPAGNWYCPNMTLESGDFNGDGRDDLMAWYSYGDGSDRLFTFTADVQGGFNSPFASAYLPVGWWEVNRSKFVTGDFNGDGRDDLAALYGYEDGSVRMHTFLTDPTGGFRQNAESWSGTATSWGDWSRSSVHAGDFNGDGRDDVGFWYDYANGADALFTLTARQDGGFNSPFRSWASDPGNWYLQNMKIVPGDYNGDGRDDLGAMYGYGDGSVRMFTWLTHPDGGFATSSPSWSDTPGNWWTGNSTFLKPYNTTSTG